MCPRHLEHSDYTVGWLCVLDTEIDAARALLDEEDESLPPGLYDDNMYILGRMGVHNVVITFTDSYGTSPATATATNMMRTFPKITFGLMVGVGGGVPNPNHFGKPEKDIRLGDAVVGDPSDNHGGVLQYNLGRWKDNEFLIESRIKKPPPILLKAMIRVKTDHNCGNGKMLDYIRQVMETAKRLPDIQDPRFPGRGEDYLYKANYFHGEAADCQNCDVNQREKRADRISEIPYVHYGLIASGNAVMRSAELRDKFRKARNVLCFEMEAAGLMNQFPCVVVRGICDYSDGHKNKLWQPYAAVVAAAYAKDFLRVIHPGELIDTEMATDKLQ